MNYRHAFHAGNLGDVLKHMALAAILAHLRTKPKAMWVMDTHAGAGLYSLTGDEATRSPEWRQGIGRLWPLRGQGAALPAALDWYLEAVAAVNPGADLAWYPGSPLLARAGMRPGDRLSLCELHGPTADQLKHHLAALDAGGVRTSVLAADGYERLVGMVPPAERRGLVLIDPAYELADDFERAATALARARKRWASGIFALWVPIKDEAEDQARMARLSEVLGAPPDAPPDAEAALSATLLRPSSPAVAGLRGARLVVLNPPWPLAAHLDNALPAVVAALDPALGFEAAVTPGLR